MARSSSLTVLSLALTLLVLSPGSLAQSWWPFRQPRRLERGQQALNECNLHRLSATEPTIRYQWEAGVAELWDPNQQEFQCTGVTVLRSVIEPRGLLLPHYVNAPLAFYIVQGNGLLGVTFPGCPETFESGSGSASFSEEGIRGSERTHDKHQRVRRLRHGDVIAVPAGVNKWVYNDGQEPLVLVAFFDTNSVHNQLDRTLRKFFLAGNPEQSEGGEGRHHMRGGQEAVTMGNIFKGFDEQFLADSFGVDRDTIQRLQGQQFEGRGGIIRVERDLQVVCPEYEEEHHHGGRYTMNGLEETFCSARLGGNVDRPHKADIYNREGGRLTFLNRNKLPILGLLDMSVDKGHLYQNAIMSPHWGINSHRIHYYTRGRGRVQVTCERGQLVFDGEVREGQLLVIPQNFVVVKQAGQEGLEWVVFNTHGESMLGTLAGRLSALRALPDEVVMNSYGVSREDARRLKFSREETHFFQPSSASLRIRQVVEEDVKA
ncbi:hypothetical protein Cgig2_022109 [Carnegiea gigantea]|uniref:Cupin type-1 domain-containing protein n=1 Tax=Carnegiea gigantea TaxID=171969 RepID=A0A9Q1K1P6_9CARY|nr:hypothetical protein Cgig2_022109 [Carnegiea gigantea]